MSFNTKYRAKEFEDFYGTSYKTITEALRKELGKKVHKHSYLLTGGYGTGKTSLARLLAWEVGATTHSLQEINVGDSTGVDMVRTLIEELEYASLVGTKVYILDEVHALTSQAQKALLKPLEEPPEHVYFVLCTTEPLKLDKGLRDRCMSLYLPGLSVGEQDVMISGILKREGLPDLSEAIKRLIRIKSEGIPRVILNLLEGISLIETEEERLAYVEMYQGMAVNMEAIELCRRLMKTTKADWNSIAEVLLSLQKQKQDPEGLRKLILSYFSKVLLGGTNDRAFTMLRSFREPLFNTGFPGLVCQCYQGYFGDRQ